MLAATHQFKDHMKNTNIVLARKRELKNVGGSRGHDWSEVPTRSSAMSLNELKRILNFCAVIDVTEHFNPNESEKLDAARMV
jgi:hypothetical protein